MKQLQSIYCWTEYFNVFRTPQSSESCLCRTSLETSGERVTSVPSSVLFPEEAVNQSLVTVVKLLVVDG